MQQWPKAWPYVHCNVIGGTRLDWEGSKCKTTGSVAELQPLGTAPARTRAHEYLSLAHSPLEVKGRPLLIPNMLGGRSNEGVDLRNAAWRRNGHDDLVRLIPHSHE